MAQYIGLHLEITLTDGSVVTGVVAALDEQTTYMTLASVTIRSIEGGINELPVFVIHGSQIRHLEVVQKPPQQAQTPQPLQQQSILQPPAPPSIPQQQQTPQTPPKQANQFVDPAIISMSIPPSPSAPLKKTQEKPQPLQQPPAEFNKPNEVTTPSAPPKTVVNNKSAATIMSSTKSTKSSTRSPKSKTTSSTAAKKEEKKESTTVTHPSASTTLSPALNGKTPKSSSSRLPFFASTRAKQPRKPIIETEVLDFEELYGSSTPKSSKNKQKASSSTAAVVEKQSKSDTKVTTKEKEKERQQEPVATIPTSTPTTTSPAPAADAATADAVTSSKADNVEKKKPSKANDIVNQEASALLASMLHLQGSPKQQEPKLSEQIEEVDTEEDVKSPSSSSTSSQPSFKIPANLIPPKARSAAKSNGSKASSSSSNASSPKTNPPTPKEKSKEKVHSPKEKTKEKSSPSPKEKPSKKNTTVVKDKGVKEKTVSSPQQQRQSVKEKSSPTPTKVVIEKKDEKVEEQEDEDDTTMPIIKTVVNGARCPVVTIEQMRKVEGICVSETGPNDEMMIENAGHGTSVMALKAIGGHRRIQPGNHNAAPVIVVLTGNTKAGSYGLAAARHLANRGCHVYVMLAFRKDAKLSDGVTMQRKCAEFAGAHIVESIEDLPQQQKTPVDLIIDGLMGSESSVSLLRGDYITRELLWDSMDWANSNKAPVLSLDFPSGINASDGLPFHVMHHIQPKWTLCFGAPKQGCTSRSITGELFLADIGIPSVSWRRIGINRCKIPWGAEFVLALEYDG